MRLLLHGATGLAIVSFSSAGVLIGGSGTAHAAVHASGVVSYSSGAAVAADGYLSAFNKPAAATGSPDDLTGEVENGYPNVLNPFSPAYESDEIVVVGEGGQLTLALPQYAVPGAGLELGVITNFGLQDSSFFGGGTPGTNYGTALGFGGGAAAVSVSADGVNFVSLGRVVFAHPANYFSNVTGAYAPAPPAGAVAADFGTPFTKDLSAFNNDDFAATIAEFGTSGGGTWIDLSGSGLPQVAFVRFAVADDTLNVIDRLGIDSVMIANTAVGSVVPEPAGVALTSSAAALALLRRRRTRRMRTR